MPNEGKMNQKVKFICRFLTVVPKTTAYGTVELRKKHKKGDYL